ncbi:MAG TPA: CpsD/CapB family tyrosine-protein kinase [Pirellulaceae bacterium]|nr:CpsD/CapB family tyrosine-protein kinase [Pirellulaceae bacterium]
MIQSVEQIRAPLNRTLGHRAVDEYMRALLTQLRLADDDAPRTIGLTSCAAREGVSTLAAGLAACAALDLGRPTLLVDAHLAHPDVNNRFGVSDPRGLAEYLAGQTDAESCCRSTPVPNLSILAAGAPTARAASVSAPARFPALLERLKSQFAWIIVDLPSIGELHNCLPLVGALDGTVVVMESERVRASEAQRAQQRLQQANARLLGVVFNKRTLHVPEWLYRRL